MRNNERVQQPIEEVSLNPKRQLRAYVALIDFALFAAALALSPGWRVWRRIRFEDDRLCDGVWCDRGERQVVRACRRGGGTMGIAGAVYCALTFGIATGVVFVLFKCRG